MAISAAARKRYVLIGATAAAAVLVTTSLASATDHEVHACVSAATGQLRVVDAGETCKRGETAYVLSRGDVLVTGDRLASDSVDSSKVAPDSLLDVDLANDSVGSGEIKTGAVGTAEVADETLTSQDLAGNSVGTSEIADFTVLAEDLETGFLRSLVSETEFTDRLSTPTSSPTTAGTSPQKTPNNADSVVDWSKLKNVPSDFADNVDDDGTGALNDFKNELKNAGTPDTASNEVTDPVSWHKLNHVPTGFADGTDDVDGGIAIDLNCTGCLTAQDLGNDAVEGPAIRNGTITSEDLAGTYDTYGTHAEIVLGAVTGEKILDGTIAARDLATDSVDATKIGSGQIGSDELAAGAVTTDKQTANIASAGEDPGGMPSAPSGGGAVLVPQDPTRAELAIPAGPKNHRVLVTANAQLTCSACQPGPASSMITYQLVKETATPGTFAQLSPLYSTTLQTNDASEGISLTFLHVDAAARATHNYKLRVTYSAATTVSAVSVSAVDLGRAP